jgi:hypothetical protein
VSRRIVAAVVTVLTVGAAPACAPAPDPPRAVTPATAPAPPPDSGADAATPQRAQPNLPDDPVRLVGGLVGDERTLRDPAAAERDLTDAARRQQAAYRRLARHPEWDTVARPLVPADLLDGYDRNIDARRQLEGMNHGPGRPTLPAWRITPPPPAPQLRAFYAAAEAESGVPWNYLAAINLVETAFGRIAGTSGAGAQGPMQFLPSTFAVYGRGDIGSPRDSIAAAGRFLAAHGFARDRDAALYRYNNSRNYVRAVEQYAALIAAYPTAMEAYHRWDVYYRTAAGDVVLPVGYAETAPIPVGPYLAVHPQ